MYANKKLLRQKKEQNLLLKLNIKWFYRDGSVKMKPLQSRSLWTQMFLVVSASSSYKINILGVTERYKWKPGLKVKSLWAPRHTFMWIDFNTLTSWAHLRSKLPSQSKCNNRKHALFIKLFKIQMLQKKTALYINMFKTYKKWVILKDWHLCVNSLAWYLWQWQKQSPLGTVIK